jgi:membrane associated rhomboid family serine protease
MLSGIMGNVISSIFLPTNITVGASGAVFGLFGAMWGDFIQNCGLYKGARCAQLFSLLFMTIIKQVHKQAAVACGVCTYLDI